MTYICNETLCLRGHVTHKCFMICFFLPWIRFIFLELLWEVFWLKNLLNTHTNLPEFNLWSCVIPLVTLLSSTRHGQQTGKEHRDKWSCGINFLAVNCASGLLECVSDPFPARVREVCWESLKTVTPHFCFSFWLMPAFMLKKIVLGNFASGPLDPEMADGIDFMVDRVGCCVLWGLQGELLSSWL